MGDRGVEPNEVLCCSHQLGSEVDQFVRQAQMGLAARGTMTARIFDAISLMNDHTRLPSITWRLRRVPADERGSSAYCCRSAPALRHMA
jgi:hypothetical protein